MRFSRPCYDKPLRCPGWAGGGMRYARRDRCAHGRMSGWHGDRPWPTWSLHRCDTCDVVTWPYVVRWLNPVTVARELRDRWAGRARRARETEE